MDNRCDTSAEPAVAGPVHARWCNRTSDRRRGRIVTGALEVADAQLPVLVAVGLPRRPLEGSTTARGSRLGG
jgi:hypothetical protein